MQTGRPQDTLSQNLEKTAFLISQGRFSEAESLCDTLLAADPDNLQALELAGRICQQTRRLEQALVYFSRICELAPDTPALMIKLARALNFAGKPAKAQTICARAILLEPGNREYKAIFTECLSGVAFNGFSPQTKDVISLCLKEPDLSHRKMSMAWMAMIEHDPKMSPLTGLVSCADYDAFKKAFDPAAIADLLNESFIVEGLRKCGVYKPPMERLMTWLRRFFLTNSTPEDRERVLPFLCALSAQCLHTEYLYAVSPEEEGALSALKNAAESSAMPLPDLALLACYTPVHATAAAQVLAGQADETESPDMIDFIRRQILIPLEEESLRRRIPSLFPVNDETSLAVQKQYEENPYPRWSSLPKPDIPDEKKKQAKGKEVLVAGCGTGKDAIQTAFLLPYARIDAVDLSRASLAYALLRAKWMGAENLSFIQGDILDLPKYGKTYDFITSSGVLHHMKDPAKGLSILRDLLHPAGTMMIYLYSEVARKHVAACQAWARDQGFTPTAEDIRKFRATILENGLFQKITQGSDFYSISECRDLLFHVQEHRFTCLDLKRTLKELDLELLFFGSTYPGPLLKYRQTFNSDPHAVSLENWHLFEQQHPNAFLGMYKMLLCRKGAHKPGYIPPWLHGLGLFAY